MDQDITKNPQPDFLNQPQENPPIKKDYLSKAKAYFKITSIIVAILLIIVIILLIITGGSFNENGAGAVWWVLIPVVPFMYAVPILLILGIINAILYAKDKKKIKQ